MELQHHFLIAMPHLEDDFFRRSVVYICEHNDQGTMGLVLTQPTDLSLAELCAKMNFMMANDRYFPDQLILAGGPVNLERGFILHSKTNNDFEHSYKVTEDIYLTTSADVINSFGTVNSPDKYIMALGCASWSPNQLEMEIINGDWLIVPATEHILFDISYDERWFAANQLLGIESANFSHQIGHS
ncbi:putative transcriptional regulator [Bisgaardia hudsonensis]|uniref:UPF0301 protein EV697_10414 n=1 Tax=Bisgaardia hudsonensis TaxID=109472 RepID=A0A4R2MSS6_9PAST|nr:YqgE/AlgH family protein [Bisgaardia hudsonensis]QLB12172.1 hypothetical protein A6A11_00355 [Bisgaardia hudsonensis]TCP12209.1 putative transcriptional regulator [Bisgaardia hudsonensis]